MEVAANAARAARAAAAAGSAGAGATQSVKKLGLLLKKFFLTKTDHFKLFFPVQFMLRHSYSLG